jgi:hypothetical protein
MLPTPRRLGLIVSMDEFIKSPVNLRLFLLRASSAGLLWAAPCVRAAAWVQQPTQQSARLGDIIAESTRYEKGSQRQVPIRKQRAGLARTATPALSPERSAGTSVRRRAHAGAGCPTPLRFGDFLRSLREEPPRLSLRIGTRSGKPCSTPIRPPCETRAESCLPGSCGCCLQNTRVRRAQP